jgi:hypothetical protein
MSLEIEAQDVIKIVLQFCKENSLTDSFNAIQRECQVLQNSTQIGGLSFAACSTRDCISAYLLHPSLRVHQLIYLEPDNKPGSLIGPGLC